MQYVFGALFKGINRKLEALAFIPLIVNNHSRHVIQSLNSKTYSLNVKVLFTLHMAKLSSETFASCEY